MVYSWYETSYADVDNLILSMHNFMFQDSFKTVIWEY